MVVVELPEALVVNAFQAAGDPFPSPLALRHGKGALAVNALQATGDPFPRPLALRRGKGGGRLAGVRLGEALELSRSVTGFGSRDGRALAPQLPGLLPHPVPLPVDLLLAVGVALQSWVRPVAIAEQLPRVKLWRLFGLHADDLLVHAQEAQDFAQLLAEVAVTAEGFAPDNPGCAA
jgi:hypothetical protein